MRNLLYLVAFAAVFAVSACSGAAPDPAPTATLVPTPVPTATPAPTATLEPTTTLEPTATPAPTATLRPTLTPELAGESPEETGSSRGIAPLSMGDPDALMSQLPPEELGCLMEGTDLARLVELQQDPRSATPEETEKAIDCLGDESALRAFLTELIGLTGPLSGDSSDCLRAAFGAFDVRSVMLARQVAPERHVSRMGTASAFMLTLSCLNEVEWGLYVPAMIMNPDDRGKLQCVVETLGGTKGLAASLQSGDGGVSEALLDAADGCELRMAFFPGG